MRISQKIVLLFIFCFLLTGCTKNKDEQSKKVDISPIASEQDNTKGNEKLVIGSITMSNDGEWYGEVMAGVKAAASDLGITLVEKSSNGDVDEEEKFIRGFIKDGVDSIIICPITSDRTGKVLEDSEKAGIPTITWNTTVNSKITAEVCVDSNALGGDTGRYLSEYVRTYNLSNIKLGLLTNKSYDIGVARCDGFKESINDMVKDGSVSIVSEILAETTEESTEAVKKMLTENPDINMIWCWNQTSLLACIDTVKEMGKKDIDILGTDMSMDLAKDMQEDDVKLLAVTTQLPYNMGYKAVVNAVQAAKGNKVDETIVIPTFTYKKSDTDGIKQYIESHAAFAQ